MEIGDGQHVGDAERLGDIALALYLAHPQRVAADAVGAFGQAERFGRMRCLIARFRSLLRGATAAG